MSVNSLCEIQGITQGAITAKCDGEGTIKIVQHLHAIIKNNRKHFDLIQALAEAIKISPIQWQFEHLKGHQDKYISYSQLDRWAQLNVQADAIAKQEVTRLLRAGGREGNSIQIPFDTCRIYWTSEQGEEELISSKLSETLINHIQTRTIKRYWEKKRKMGIETSAKVDWHALQKSATSYQ
jgi:hypothetical protein